MISVGEEGIPIQVLLVEDSPGDVRLMQEAFRDINGSINLQVATDGVEAMAFLGREGAHVDALRPDLILLDLNLPRMDGREVLALIKQDDNLKIIPTVVLTTSETEADVVISYRLQANCYLRKPTQWDAFDSIVRSINTFWLAKARLPQPKPTLQEIKSQPGQESASSLGLGSKREGIVKWIGADGMSIDVLLVEDSPGDVRLTQEAFHDANPAIHLHVASDGVEAMAFLRREGIHVDAPRPDLILLDLNLPKMDGREVLAHIKEDDSLKLIPTVILTTSDAEADIVKSYQLQANCYLTKPVQLDEFESLVKSINDFWLTKVKLPQQAQG
jgi:chemotaxis family two-component system response regulator Rcp1